MTTHRYQEFFSSIFADLNEGIPAIVTTVERALLEGQIENGDMPLVFVKGIDPETFEVSYDDCGE